MINRMELDQLYRSVPTSELCKRYGCTPKDIYNAAYELGAQRPQLSYEEKVKILALRLNGVAKYKIGMMVGRSQHAVNQLCKRVGIN